MIEYLIAIAVRRRHTWDNKEKLQGGVRITRDLDLTRARSVWHKFDPFHILYIRPYEPSLDCNIINKNSGI